MNVPEPHPSGAAFHVSAGTACIVVNVAGEIDAATAPVLAGILDVLQTAAATDVQLDASKVTFADSAFVRTVLDARRRYARNRGWVAVIHPSRCVCRLLALTGMGQLLQPRGSEQRNTPHRHLVVLRPAEHEHAGGAPPRPAATPSATTPGVGLGRPGSLS